MTIPVLPTSLLATYLPTGRKRRQEGIKKTIFFFPNNFNKNYLRNEVNGPKVTVRKPVSLIGDGVRVKTLLVVTL